MNRVKRICKFNLAVIKYKYILYRIIHSYCRKDRKTTHTSIPHPIKLCIMYAFIGDKLKAKIYDINLIYSKKIILICVFTK